MFKIALLAFAGSLLPSSLFASAQITYHGRLLKSDNTPVLSSNVQFRIQVRSPGSESCLFFDETHTRDMSVSDGNFAITLGDGTASSVNTEPFSLERAFQNRGPFTFAVGKCSGGGTTYSPAATDGRKLVLQFNDGSGWETVPTQSINQVPQAAESMSVGGYRSGDLFRVVDGSGNPVALSAWAQSDYTNLLSIVSSGNTSGNSAGFTGVLAGDVSGAQGATLVGKIQGRAVDATAPSSGQVLKWNGSAWAPAADAGGSGTVLTVSGTGAIQITGTSSDPIVGVRDASTSQKGVVQLAASSDTTAGLAVQANDTRLTDSRAPNGSAGGDLTGSYPSPTLALVGTAGSYYKVTTDSKGRVTNGVTSLNYEDISNAASKYLTYKPNNSACADGQVLKWINANQRWECANDAGAAGTIASLTTNSPIVKTGTSSDPIISVQDASTSQKGAVQLASSADTSAGLAIQANDTRLSDARTPTAHTHVVDQITSAVGKYFTYLPNNTACADGQLLKWNLAQTRWECGTAASSEATTASNVGTAGVGVFKQLSTYDLQFKKLNAASNVTLTDDTANSKIDIGVNLSGVFGNNTGLIVSDGTQLQNKACSANQILKWLSPTGWTCAADDGLTSESDPKVGANTANYLSKWSGTQLVASGVYESGGSVGIGTNTPTTTLDVNGTVKISGGTPAAGRVLTSDASGLASWQPIGSTGGGLDSDANKALILARYAILNGASSAKINLTNGIIDTLKNSTAIDTGSSSNVSYGTGSVSAGIKTTYSYTGADQTFNVPAGVTSIDIKMWGAGGGSGATSANGGAGGHTSAVVTVTPLEALTIMVGGAGTYNGSGTYGGGGNSGQTSGGGRSALRRSTTELATAGGGGGAGSVAGNNGGAGGGSSGSAGSGAGTPGGGGSQVAGGTSAQNPGSQYAGGNGNGSNSGGGGGGGWYGGGSGRNGSGAGGGSGYVGGSGVTGTTTAGTNDVPPATGDASYQSGIAIGGTNSGAGGNGLVVVTLPGAATLQSTAFTASAVPSTAFVTIRAGNLSGVTLNSDLNVYVSRNGGTTWSQVTLSSDGDYTDSQTLLIGSVSLTSQSSGTSMKWRITSVSGKYPVFYGVSLQWE